MLINIITHIDIFVKEREKAGAVQPETEAEKGPFYRVSETNAPDASLLVGLVEVIEKEQGNRNKGNPSFVIPERAFRDIAKKR